MVSKGMRQKEMAEKLNVTKSTISYDVKAIIENSDQKLNELVRKMMPYEGPAWSKMRDAGNELQAIIEDATSKEYVSSMKYQYTQTDTEAPNLNLNQNPALKDDKIKLQYE
jgi:transcriptional regulator with XRE-family HTH domain